MSPEKRRFQVKLYLALEQSRVDGFEDAISWMPHGRAFKINDKEKLMTQVLGPHLNMKPVYPSFLRQICIYSFIRLTNASGEESSGAYFNEYFLTGRPALLRRMKRVRLKGTGMRSSTNFNEEPDLFSMPRCGNIASAVPNEYNIVSHVNANKTEVSKPKDCRFESIYEGYGDNEELVGQFEGNIASAVPDEYNIVSHVNANKIEVSKPEDCRFESIYEGYGENEELVGRFEGNIFFLDNEQSLVSSNHSSDNLIGFGAGECKEFINAVD